MFYKLKHQYIWINMYKAPSIMTAGGHLQVVWQGSAKTPGEPVGHVGSVASP